MTANDRILLSGCAACKNGSKTHPDNAVDMSFSKHDMPLKYWFFVMVLVKCFLALYFMATNKDTISAIALAKYIDVILTGSSSTSTVALWVNVREFASSSAQSKWMKPYLAEKQRANVGGAVTVSPV